MQNNVCELLGIAALIHVSIAIQLHVHNKLIFQLWQFVVLFDAVKVRIARISLRIHTSISGPNYVLSMCTVRMYTADMHILT